MNYQKVIEETGENHWTMYASCAETDPEVFFAENAAEVYDARKICDGCFVKTECAIYAITNNIMYGVWGGLSVAERKRAKAHHTIKEIA